MSFKLKSLNVTSIEGDALLIDVTVVEQQMSWDDDGQETYVDGDEETLPFAFRSSDQYGLSPQVKSMLIATKADLSQEVQDWMDEYMAGMS